MEIEDSSGTIRVRAFAKVNLFLEILSRRADGYHDLESVFHEIDLADEITLSPADTLRVACSDSTIPEEKNLATIAANLLREQTGAAGGARIEITKRIPSGAGLGGGSSDAAAVLAGLNRLWKLGLGLAQLKQIGGRVGSDVPFFFHGGTARVRGRGERITPLESAPTCYFVVIQPSFSISTEQVYKNPTLDLTSRRKDAISMVEALRNRRVAEIGRHLFNRLQPVALELYPALQGSLDLLGACETSGVLMSGSGSAVFALHDSPDAARETRERVVRQATDYAVSIAQSTVSGQ